MMTSAAGQLICPQALQPAGCCSVPANGQHETRPGQGGGRWAVCLLTTLLLLTGCQPRNQLITPPPPKVTVALPLQKPVLEYFETTGRTRAVANIELRARVGGYLESIAFRDGDNVRKGELLFVIDKAPFEAALASAQAQLAKAEAQLQLAEQQLARTSALALNDAATKSALDIQEAERASRVADVAASKAAVRDAELNLSYTEIHAPFDGRIGRHLVDIGNLVIEGQTVLGTLDSTDPIHVYFELSETDLLKFMEMIRTGVLKFSDASPPQVEMALGSSGDFAYKGVLDFRAFGVDPGTGTTERRAVFPNPDGELIPGLFVRVRIALGEPKEQLVVEERALSSDQRGDFVLVVNSKNVVEQRPVKLGILTGGMRVILSGITPQDRIVINGLQRARPGSTVDPTLSTMGAPPTVPQTAPPAAAADPKPEATDERQPAAPAAETATDGKATDGK
ncbi:efflux RND transporter periplasmic adaptor subunit [Planctomicrobium sp. SH664]|uniref:efflux RND transporter periplasmic adaptor subunit n=1 Tax=Planctomicrobium sp. SH664 TaxID=3448125 RepID=UPI003F5C1FDE